MSSNPYDSVPAALKAETRWMLWKVNPAQGNKPPIDASGYPVRDWSERKTNGILMTFEQASKLLDLLPFPAVGPSGRNAGLGLADQGGLDLDNSVLPDGSIDPRADAIIAAVPGWVEYSASGKGLKVYFSAAKWAEIDFAATPLVAAEKTPNYFACTGKVYRDGDPTVDGTRALALVTDMLGTPASRKEKKQTQRLDADGGVVRPGTQEGALFREACRLRRNGWTEQEVTHGLFGLITAGRFPSEQGKPAWTYADAASKARSACRFAAGEAPEVDFETNDKGSARPSGINIRRAVIALGVDLIYDEFMMRKYITRDDKTSELNDSIINALRFECESRYKLLFPKELFWDALDMIAKENRVHPVREYLSALEWDGSERLGKWLVNYGGADDSAYVRAVGRIVLKAAVKRILEPGCMFQELLVLESPQGFEKSSAMRALMPKPEWFTDSMPLGVDSKIAIERSAGIWLVEASEMLGHSKKETDDVKGFLSRDVDGPVRLAYGREPERVPRQWIAIGTTNAKHYLRDATGGRRFWPVPVGRFKVDKITADRDQLWAEAMFDLKQDPNVRLNPTLWGDAKVQQDARGEQDAWHEKIEETIGEDTPGKIRGQQLLALLDLSISNMSSGESARLGSIMRRLKFERKKVRVGKVTLWVYVRPDPDRPDGSIRELPWLLGTEGIDDADEGQELIPGTEPPVEPAPATPF
jgi:hypothetical protein